ncbi:MAG: hypothetical protein E7008_00470 [Alphaproteobacteria bacterium]|nr:hypothetical protein [Alphaproteobacteria bacterium]
MQVLIVILCLFLAYLLLCFYEFKEALDDKKRKQKLMSDLEILIKATKKSVQKLNKHVGLWRQDYVDMINECMERYYKVLETKYFQLVFVDDYGRAQLSDFERELINFSYQIVFEDEIQYRYQQIVKEFIGHASFSDVIVLRQYMKQNGLSWKEVEQLWPAWRTDLRYVLEAGLLFAAEVLRQWFPPMDKGILLEDAVPENDAFETFYDGYFNLEGFLDVKGAEIILKANAKVLCFSIIDNLFDITFRNAVYKNKSFTKIGKQSAQQKETPQQYERHIATNLKKLGFEARTTKASGDQGADVLASKDGVSFAIQCKMYSKPVGNKAVQEANAGRDFYKKDYGVVISNAGFTKSARQAAHACGIILLNDNQLESLLKYTNR